MKCAWIGIALLASSWLAGLDYYHQPDPWLWAVAVVAGTILMIGAIKRIAERKKAIVAVFLLLPALLLAPWPHRIAPLLMALGLALSALGGPRKWPARIGSGALSAGLILLVQSLTIFTYKTLTARSHDLPYPVPQCLAWFARQLGMDATADGPNLVIFAMRESQPIGATWELLVDPPSLCFLTGGFALIALRQWSTGTERTVDRILPWIGLTAAVVLWLPIRTMLLLATHMHRVLRTDYEQTLDVMDQYWSYWVHLALLAGAVLLAWQLVQMAGTVPATTPQRAASTVWKRLVPTAFAAVAVAVLCGAIFWDTVGERKAGRILIDELHSQSTWSGKTFDTTRTDRPYDTEWYGREAAYNLACIYDYCSRFYAMSRLMTQTLDDRVLEDKDVLVLKVPSRRFAHEEIQAIRRFVDRGGGLLLIGEHTTVYGSGVCLNEIARLYGFEFRYDCLFGVDSVFDQLYVPPLIPHPAIQHMGPMEFAVSCSIKPGTGSGRAVILATGLKNLGSDYHSTNFYPQAVNQPEMQYGGFVQLWATRAGRGRVLAFTDSTILANFSAFEPGKKELMLGMLEWLNHRDTGFTPMPWLLGLGLVLAILSLMLARSTGTGWLLLVAAAVLGWSIAVVGIRIGHRSIMPLPEPVRPFVSIGIDRTVSSVPLPKNGFIAGKENHFGLFERHMLRLGYFFSRGEGGELFDADTNLVVVLHPSLEVEPAFRKRLVEYVADGGKLLVLDSKQNRKSTANTLLEPFGLKIDHSIGLEGELAKRSDLPAIKVEGACPVEGGEPLAHLEDQIVAAFTRHHAGSVTVIGFGSRFSDRNMGVTGDLDPSPELRQVFEYQFALVRTIISDKLNDSPSPADPQPEIQ